MADLDYAFLAEFAKVESNKLTTVGGSYTHLLTPRLPSNHLLFVAGRVRIEEQEDAPVLGIEFRSPDSGVEIGLETTLSKEGAHPYAGKVGLTFAVGFGVPLMVEGLYDVFVELNGTEMRRLAFTLVQGKDEK